MTFPKIGARIRDKRHEKAGQVVGFADDGAVMVVRYWWPYHRRYHYEIVMGFIWETYQNDLKDGRVPIMREI